MALLVAACNQGDNALFGSDLPPVSDDGGRGGAQPSGGTTVAAGTATSGGAGGGAGGAAGLPGGGKATTAGSAGRATAGAPNPPDPPDAAGAAGADGGVGGGMEPPEPICGNGVIEAGEQCDGGSGTSGCDDKCRVVCSDHGTGTVESEAHHCYKGYDEDDFDGAQQACLKLGGHLATLSTAAENKLILEFVRESKWVGGFEDVPLSSEGTGKYAWITGEAFSYTSWAEGEPDRAASRCGSSAAGGRCYEHCIAVVRDGSWMDQRCDRVDGYICEWEPPGTTK
jgi:hypothetical protein